MRAGTGRVVVCGFSTSSITSEKARARVLILPAALDYCGRRGGPA
jgi:hypothetical protein